MVANISIKSNIKDVVRSLNKVQRKQVPFATMRAINDTAFDVMRENKKQLPKYLDNPTPFTIRGVKVSKATKQNLDGIVYFDKIQAEYMKLQIAGGTRTPKRKVILIPQKTMRRNKYGNVTRSARQKLFTNKDKYYSTNVGIYERYGPGKRLTRLVARFVDRAEYKQLYPFKSISRRHANKVFAGYFRKRLAYALKTAR